MRRVTTSRQRERQQTYPRDVGKLKSLRHCIQDELAVLQGRGVMSFAVGDDVAAAWAVSLLVATLALIGRSILQHGSKQNTKTTAW
jgi:hypothetical protein